MTLVNLLIVIVNLLAPACSPRNLITLKSPQCTTVHSTSTLWPPIAPKSPLYHPRVGSYTPMKIQTNPSSQILKRQEIENSPTSMPTNSSTLCLLPPLHSPLPTLRIYQFLNYEPNLQTCLGFWSFEGKPNLPFAL